ncbi:MAG: hemolysin family protein [Acidaminococcales bacterium]|nr:hemolysin family protein [Acidaminococcales bacterium]
MLVGLNGFFVAAEFSMVKVRAGRLDTLVREGNRRARYARAIAESLDAYLSACQLGITLASLGLGWIGEPAVAHMIAPLLYDFGLPAGAVGSISFIAAFSIITALHIILGELMPKTLSIQMAETVTLFTALPLIAFYKAMYPFIWLLNTLSNKLLAGIGVKIDTPHEAAHSDEELRQLFEESHKSGLIDQTEMSLMDNVIDFSDRTAREIMIPRTEMICLYTNKSFEDNLEIALREQLTRFPVCGTDKDNIIGFVHTKDILYMLAKQTKKDINSLIRPLNTVPETLCISELFKQMQKERAQIVLLIDEYGGTAGIVTLEDIVEEVFGEIRDEFDEEREPVEEISEGYSVDGLVLVEDINNLLGLELDTEAADTIGGWLYCRIGVDPAPGQIFSCGGYQFEVAEVVNLRIVRVKIRKQPEGADEGAAPSPRS